MELVLGRLTGKARIVVGETPTSIEDIVSKLQGNTRDRSIENGQY